MFNKISSFAKVTQIGCCGCFGFSSAKTPKARYTGSTGNHVSRELLIPDEVEDEVEEEEDDCSYNGDITEMGHGDESEMHSPTKRSEEIILYRTQHGLICREFPVKETHELVRSEDEHGNKMVNEYVREYKIGSGSYGKVVLYRSSVDGNHYAIKAFHKSYLSKLRVAPSETAMTDVLREVKKYVKYILREITGRSQLQFTTDRGACSPTRLTMLKEVITNTLFCVLIMKMLEHPNIVNLVEVIDDPTTDHFYMVLEYVEGKWVCEGSGPPASLEQKKAQNYLRDIVSGLMYLHAHNIVHGDIKPDNLLVTAAGRVKIADFSVSQVFEDDNDQLRRSPGTPVFTAPECCLGLTYGGKGADTWAVGVTLYCMIFGKYPFLGETLQDTYDKIVNDPLSLLETVDPLLRNLLEGLLCKDPSMRMTLKDVSEHGWFLGEEGPIPQYLCWCKRNKLKLTGTDEEGCDRDNVEHTK